MIGGVCAGLSEYFKIDVTIIRIILAVMAFGYGSGIAVYLILWMLLPDKRDIGY